MRAHRCQLLTFTDSQGVRRIARVKAQFPMSARTRAALQAVGRAAIDHVRRLSALSTQDSALKRTPKP